MMPYKLLYYYYLLLLLLLLLCSFSKVEWCACVDISVQSRQFVVRLVAFVFSQRRQRQPINSHASASNSTHCPASRSSISSTSSRSSTATPATTAASPTSTFCTYSNGYSPGNCPSSVSAGWSNVSDFQWKQQQFGSGAEDSAAAQGWQGQSLVLLLLLLLLLLNCYYYYL